MVENWKNLEQCFVEGETARMIAGPRGGSIVSVPFHPSPVHVDRTDVSAFVSLLVPLSRILAVPFVLLDFLHPGLLFRSYVLMPGLTTQLRRIKVGNDDWVCKDCLEELTEASKASSSHS